MTIEQLRNKYLEKPKERKVIQMPKFFKFGMFTILLLILWKLYANFEAIVTFLTGIPLAK